MTEQSGQPYPPPIDQLLALGAPKPASNWLNYAMLGIGPEHILDLIRMLTDKVLFWADSESAEVYAPTHAWRALGQLRARAAIPPLLALLHWTDDEGLDYIGEEFPIVFGLIGEPAIPGLTEYMACPDHGQWARGTAIVGLSQIAQHHPELRDRCIAILVRQLCRHANQDRAFNASLIYELSELGAIEAAPAIEAAFEADHVDLSFQGDWEEVQIKMGLLEKQLTPRPRWTMIGGHPIESDDAVRLDQQERNRLRRLLEAEMSGTTNQKKSKQPRKQRHKRKKRRP